MMGFFAFKALFQEVSTYRNVLQVSSTPLIVAQSSRSKYFSQERKAELARREFRQYLRVVSPG